MSKYINEILAEKDYKRVIQSSSNLGNNPSRETIETLLQQDGGTLPVFDMTFYLTDPNSHNMQVTYIRQLNQYFYISMTDAK